MLKSFLRIALRNLIKNKSHSIINIIGLIAGFVAFGFIMLYVANEMSYDSYNTNADRIVRVVQHAKWDGNEVHEAVTSAPFAPAMQAAFPEIENAARIDLEGGAIITFEDKKIKQQDIVFADKSLPDIFSYHFIYGDPHTALSSQQSIILTESLANKLFGNVNQAKGKTLYLNNDPAVVTAVIKDIPFNSHLRFSAVRPMPDEYKKEGWQNFHFYTYLLLKKGTDYTSLEKKLPEFAAHNIQQQMKIKDYAIELQPLRSIHLHSALSYEISSNGTYAGVYTFIALAILIILLAMINYINLTTARCSTRLKEVGIRKVSGASKWNIGSIFITESLLTTIIAAVTSLIIIYLTLPLFSQVIGKELSIEQIGTGRILFNATAVIGIVGLLAGFYPAIFMARFKPMGALKEQARSLFSGAALRRLLVVFQFSISVVMICGSIVIYKQLEFALHSNLGFNKNQVLTFHIDNQKIREQIPALKAMLSKSPLIEGVAAAGNPIGNNDLGGLGYKFENMAGDFTTPSIPAQELMADADFLQTMEISLVKGRGFSSTIQSDQYAAALINETLMQKLGWKDPIGKRMKFPIDDKGTMAERTVIGVVKDFHTYSLQHKIEPLVMVMPPIASMKDNLYVKIAKGKTREGLAFLKNTYRQFDPTNLTEYHFLDWNFAQQYDNEQREGKIALIFSILAVIIACMGLFGLVSFTALQRTKEIGIRKVFGAKVIHLVNLLSRDFLKLVVISSIISLPVAWFVTKLWLKSFAYKTELSWWIYAAGAGISVIIALFTVSGQALKAAKANPVESLHTE